MGFLYLDTPYFDSNKAGYNACSGASHYKNLKMIDNNQMYVDFCYNLENGQCKFLV
jgi:hypothetical protein